jgi:hypothetical protein
MIETLPFSITKEQTEIIKAVLYYDVFNYPLTIDELYENSAVTISKEAYMTLLNSIFKNGLLQKKDEFVLSVSATEKEIRKRQHGNNGALAVLPTAYTYSKIIASFPFVEGVCLSGSLSKNYYDEKSDIDFFIITRPDRLWICRTLLILRYKLLPKHKKKYWCTNYFISSDSLAIPDINAFTGTELAYLIPSVNYELYKELLRENSWYKKRFPNKKEATGSDSLDTPRPFLKSFIEGVFGGNFGKWLDDKLLYVTLRHWQKKYPELAHEDFELQFRSRKNVCKRHTKGFQNKVLKVWEEKQAEYEKKFNIVLR